MNTIRSTESSSIWEEAVQAIREFATNPAIILVNYWTEYKHPHNSEDTHLHCYPGIRSGQPVLIIIPATNDAEEDATNLQICDLRPLPKRIEWPLEVESTNEQTDWTEIYRQVAQERVDRWINDAQRMDWFNRVGPYQCVVFPSNKLENRKEYTVYLALSGTDAQLAGDLIMEEKGSNHLFLQDTVQLIPPFGTNSVTTQSDFGLFNKALHGTVVNAANVADETVGAGPPAIVAFGSDHYVRSADSQRDVLICAFEQNGKLSYAISRDNGMRWGDGVLDIPNAEFAAPQKAPALAHTMGKTYCVFIKKENNLYGLQQVHTKGKDLNHWSNPQSIVKLGQDKIMNVSICAVGFKLFCVYGLVNSKTNKKSLKLIQIDLAKENPVWEQGDLTPPTPNIGYGKPSLWFMDSTLFCAYVELSNGYLWFTRSIDGGKSWDQPTAMKSADVHNSTIGHPKLCVKDKIIYCLFESNENNGQLRTIASIDHGVTWTKHKLVGGERKNLISPANCASASNVYCAWVNDQYQIEVCPSLDGLTWSKPL